MQARYVCMHVLDATIQPRQNKGTVPECLSVGATVLTGCTTAHLLEHSLVWAPRHSYLCTACHALQRSGNSASLAYIDTHSQTHTQTDLCADTPAGYYLLAYVYWLVCIYFASSFPRAGFPRLIRSAQASMRGHCESVGAACHGLHGNGNSALLVHKYVCMYVCVFACFCVCVKAHTHTHTHTHTNIHTLRAGKPVGTERGAQRQ